MGSSFRDQLLKKGLASKKQVKAVELEKKREAGKARKAKKSGEAVEKKNELAEEAARKQAEKLAHDKELNRQREIERAQNEREAQVRDLIEKSRIDMPKGDPNYNFTHGSHIKRIHVSDDLRTDLAQGRAGIVFSNEAYHIVPADAAEKILERLPGAIVLLNEAPPEPDEDDPYADYKVPDDLVW
jgi:uncharacterized protein